MAIFKRGKTYWSDFSSNGLRYRKSLRTTDWRKAHSKEKELIEKALSGELSDRSDEFSRLGFTEAAEKYLAARKPELMESSYLKEKQLLVQPKRYFRALCLQRIQRQHLLDFCDQRILTAGPTTVNMEMATIGRILKRARRWNLVGSDIKSPQANHAPSRASTDRGATG